MWARFNLRCTLNHAYISPRRACVRARMLASPPLAIKPRVSIQESHLHEHPSTCKHSNNICNRSACSVNYLWSRYAWQQSWCRWGATTIAIWAWLRERGGAKDPRPTTHPQPTVHRSKMLSRINRTNDEDGESEVGAKDTSTSRKWPRNPLQLLTPHHKANSQVEISPKLFKDLFPVCLRPLANNNNPCGVKCQKGEDGARGACTNHRVATEWAKWCSTT